MVEADADLKAGQDLLDPSRGETPAVARRHRVRGPGRKPLQVAGDRHRGRVETGEAEYLQAVEEPPPARDVLAGRGFVEQERPRAGHG